MNNYLAPIAVFAFNRRDALANMMQTLLANKETKDSDLYVFVDGPREGREGEDKKVNEVREYVLNIPKTSFRSVQYKFSEANKGLAPSIIAGVSEVIEKYGKVIVIEDDLILSKSFLKYMNEMLDGFRSDRRVMQITGYGTKFNVPKDYVGDVYLNERGHPWTWGTWNDRWKTIDWEVKDWEQLHQSWSLQKKFCKRGSDLYKMMHDFIRGKNQSWFIRFNYSMYKQGRYSICPIRSLVKNEGFTSDATNCNAYNRYKIDFEGNHNGPFIVPERLEPDERMMSRNVKYWSIRYRVYGKIMFYSLKFLDIIGIRKKMKGFITNG